MNAMFFRFAFLTNMKSSYDLTLTQSTWITLIILVTIIILILAYKNNRGSVIQYNKAANNYRTTSARITSVEVEDIYIDPYKPKPEALEPMPIRPIFVRRDSFSYTAEADRVRENNKLIRMRNSRVNMGVYSDKPNDTVQKKRYKVHYEFETMDGSTYTGEGAFFNNNGIEVGKYIDIQYKPEKPQANFPLGNI